MASVEPTKLTTTNKIMDTTKTNSADKTPRPTLNSMSTDFEDFFTLEDKFFHSLHESCIESWYNRSVLILLSTLTQ